MTDRVFLDTNILVYAIDCVPTEVSHSLFPPMKQLNSFIMFLRLTLSSQTLKLWWEQLDCIKNMDFLSGMP
jgi:hypothetical protein